MNKNQEGKPQFDLQGPADAGAKSTSISQVKEGRSTQQADKLLHELRTYQIELEMLNEELRSAYAALEASRDRYLQLYDFAPVCYLTLTEDGLIAEANLTCSTQLGVEREKLINRRFANYIKPEDGNLWHEYFLHAKQNHGKQNCEVTLCRADGTLFHAHLDSIYPEADDVPPLMHITLTDITEQKQAKETLRKVEMRHTIALACAKLGTWYWDIKTGRVDFSEHWAEMCGYRLEEIEPDISTWENAVHPEDLPAVYATLEEHFAGRSVRRQLSCPGDDNYPGRF
ncbi:MAG: PAS domain-containing protein [Methylococcaceae bacterium]|jgi:PAS domain S-box-containing protein